MCSATYLISRLGCLEDSNDDFIATPNTRSKRAATSPSPRAVTCIQLNTASDQKSSLSGTIGLNELIRGGQTGALKNCGSIETP